MNVSDILSEISAILEEINPTLNELYEFIVTSLGIAEMGIVGIVFLFTILTSVVGAIASFVFGLLIYFLESYPVYRLAKKAGRKRAYLAWIPLFDNSFRMFVISGIPGDKSFRLNKTKVLFKNRQLTFWIYLCLEFFGSAIVSALIAVLQLIPGIGQVISAFTTILYLVPSVLIALIEFVYLRDILDKFKQNRDNNFKHAIIITVLDTLVTHGIARIVVFYHLLKFDALPDIEETVQDSGNNGNQGYVNYIPANVYVNNPAAPNPPYNQGGYYNPYPPQNQGDYNPYPPQNQGDFYPYSPQNQDDYNYYPPQQ